MRSEFLLQLYCPSFGTNDSQGHSTDNKKECNQFIIENGNTVSDIEKYSQFNQCKSDKATHCAVDTHFLISLEPGELINLNRFSKEEQFSHRNEEILYWEFFVSQTIGMKFYRTWLWTFIAKTSCHDTSQIVEILHHLQNKRSKKSYWKMVSFRNDYSGAFEIGCHKLHSWKIAKR